MIIPFEFMELPAQDFEAKTGVFLNLTTGALWELFIRDGKLTVGVPNFTFEISPISKTRFRPVATQVNLEIEFEKDHQNDSLLMHVYAKGVRRATFVAP